MDLTVLAIIVVLVLVLVAVAAVSALRRRRAGGVIAAPLKGSKGSRRSGGTG